MNSTTLWTVQLQPIRYIRNAIFRHRSVYRLAALRARIRRTFIKTKPTIPSIARTAATGHHRLAQHTLNRARIKLIFISVKSTKRKTIRTDHRRLVQYHDRFRHNCDRFHRWIQPFSMNGTNPIPRIGISIIHPAAFPSIHKMVRCRRVQYRRERSKLICIKRKHRTQRTQCMVRQAMNIRHAIASFL